MSVILWGTIGGGAVLAQGLDFGSDPPWAVESPGGVGSTFGLGTEYLSERQGRLEIRSTRSVVTLRDLEHGIVTTMIENGDPALLQRKFDVEWRAQGPGVTVPFRLPSLHLPGGGGIYSSLVLDASTADVTLEFHDKPEPAHSDSLHGRGPMYGLGLDVIGTVCNRCPWYAVGYQWRNFPSLTVDRSPHFSAPGFNVLGDEVRLSRRSQSFSTRIGYTSPGNRVATYVGVRRLTTDIDVQDEVRLGSQTLRQETALSSRSKFASSGTEKVVGIDVHLGGPFFARSELAFGDRQREGLLKFVYIASHQPPPPPPWPPRDPRKRAHELASQIAPLLKAIEAEFLAAWARLPISADSTGVRVYPLRSVIDLLDKTEDQILNVLKARELAALRDYVHDEFDLARGDLKPSQIGGNLRAPAALPVRFAAAVAPARVSFAISAASPEENTTIPAADGVWDQIKSLLKTLISSAENDALLVEVYVKSWPKPGARIQINPKSYEDQPYSGVTDAGVLHDVFRGRYIYSATLAGYADLNCKESAKGCALNLVSGDDFLICCRFGQSCEVVKTTKECPP